MEDDQVDAAATDEMPTVPDPVLRWALEFAIGIAAAGAKARPPLPHPDGLRPFLRLHRLPPAAYARVRQAIEDEPQFRARVGALASAELVDEVGLVWLRREPGWRSTIDQLLAGPGGIEQQRLAAAGREQRKRQAAEDAAAKARATSEALQEQLARERAAREHEHAERLRLVDELDAARSRLAELERTVDALRDKTARARASTNAAEAAREEAASRAESAEAARDAALAARVEALDGPPALFHADELRRAYEVAVHGVHEAERAMRELGRLVAHAPRNPAVASPPRSPRARRERSRRTPLAIPGGLYGHSAAVAEHLLRVTGVLVLIDGYNVAMLGWPSLGLPEQRERCIGAAEDVARRWGTAITIVFDGADVVGTSGVRRLVRVVFSPPGVIADDVLRAQVTAADHAQALVVVSNDQAVISDVRAEGANTLSSDQFLAVARR